MPKIPKRRAFVGTPDNWAASVAFFTGTVARDLAVTPWTLDVTANVVEHAWHNAARRTVIDLRAPDVIADLRAVACVTAAMFAAESVPAGTTVDVPHPAGGTVPMVGVGPAARRIDTTHFRRGILAALVVRHRESLEMLGSVSLETLRAIGPGDAGWMVAERSALRALALGAGDGRTLVASAVAVAEQGPLSRWERTWVFELVLPELRLALAVLDRNQTAFDVALAEAIVSHHRHYGRATTKRDVAGQLALSVLAIACLAHDAGMRVTLDSDYVPAWLVEGPSA